jgi:hypothetical protein
MTPDEAIAKIKALGVELDKADVTELGTLPDAQIHQFVEGWLAVVQPGGSKNAFLAQILNVLANVTQWVGVVQKIAGLFGITL